MFTSYSDPPANANQFSPASGWSEPAWFAVQTRPRHEKRVAAEVESKGITVFLPLFSERHQWSDRRRLVHVPLFSGYVFIRMAQTIESRISVLRTNGVMKFVGARGTGVPIPEKEIDAVQTVLTHRVPFAHHPFLNVGRRVRIRGGSLNGLEGILMAKNGDESLVVSVEIVQRSVSIRVAGYQVEPVQ
jgi:transcription antitermination factor NusG